jgi:hypothetical protein
MFEALGYQVTKLQRVAFAGITFHGLRVGDARELTQAEVNELRRSVGLSTTTVSRGTWSAKREETELRRRARAREREAAAPEPAADAPPRSAPASSKSQPKPRTKAGRSPSGKRSSTRTKSGRGRR